MRWLKWEKRCMLVLCERSPRECSCGRPDVLGVSQGRYAIEIEIKRTLSDFKSDAHKASRRNRDLFPERFPKYFYYLTPPDFSEAITPLLPSRAGQMVADTHRSWSVNIIKSAPVNTASKKFSIRECVRLAFMMSSQVLSVETSMESITSMHRHGHQPLWHSPEHYEI